MADRKTVLKGSEKVIAALNAVLCKELTGINQYFIHSKMCKDWGFEALAKHAWDESIDEMKHADLIIDRILLLKGRPDMSKYDTIRVGGTVEKQLKYDLQLESDAVENLRQGIQACVEAKDYVTQELLESLLKEEEAHVDWLETQLAVIAEIGYQLWLSKQL